MASAMRRDDDDRRPGDVVGGYTIRSLLGVGGMGRVYRAVGTFGDEVALKLLKPEIARDPIVRRRFQREARVAERIGHRHVVPVIGVGVDDGALFMAQMLIRGGSLEDRIKRERRLSVEAAVSICMQVASGLDAIHAAGLIHRDVKPANILLDEQGIAYITDFGLCKDTARSVLLSRSGEKPAPSELTRPGQALGSLDYISPEQIRAEAVGPAADVYGLGCVMFAALTGEPPFADRQGMTVLWAHLQDDPPDLCAERPELPAEFGAAILRALAKDSAERPQSAGEYARAVAAAAGVA